MPDNHAADAASSVVQHTSLLLVVEHGLELAEDGVVVVNNELLVVRLLAEQADGVGSVRPSLRVLVGQTVDNQLHEGRSEFSDGALHVSNAVRNGANGVAALERLLATGVLHDGLLKDLPKLAKVLTKSSRQAGHAVKSDLNDKPVVLGRFLEDLIVLLTEILLASVTLGQDGDEVLSELRNDVALFVDKNGGASELESGAQVTEDVGNGATVEF